MLSCSKTVQIINRFNKFSCNKIVQIINRFSCSQIIPVVLALILIVGYLLTSICEFAADKLSFYQTKISLEKAHIDESKEFQPLFSISGKNVELTQLNRFTNEDERYNGAILKIKNMTDGICKLDKSFFEEMFVKYDSIEFKKITLNPAEEALIYITYKNLNFHGYQTNSIRHKHPLFLTSIDLIPEELRSYGTINTLLSLDYGLVEKKSSTEPTADIEKKLMYGCKPSSDCKFNNQKLIETLNWRRDLSTLNMKAQLKFCKT